MGSWVEYTQPFFQGLNMRNLTVDHAYLRINSFVDRSSWIYYLSEECYTCPYTRLKQAPAKQNIFLNLDISRPLSFKVFERDIGIFAFENVTTNCHLSVDMGEFGVYNMSIHPNKTCSFQMEKEPVNIYLPLLLITIFTILAVLIINGSLYLWRRRNTNSNESTNNTEEQIISKKRLQSLDTFRGMVIALMIFVNSGGGNYWWVDHAIWNGLHLADIVFPCFIWIMGVCVPISIKSQLNRGVKKKDIFFTILWRSVKLILIGICLNSLNGPNLKDLRIMGVLQRFGISYFCSGTAHLICTRSQTSMQQGKLRKIFNDLTIMKGEFLFIMILMFTHLVVLFGVEVPGCPRGYIGPGGKHFMAKHPHCTGGIVGYIDRKVLGDNHIYKYPTAKHVYNSIAFDPEGLFGCILTIVQTLCGVHCGVILITFPEWKSRTIRLIIWSIVLGFLGSILCLFSKEQGWIPINKNLWSLSFVCVTSAIAFLLLAAFYFIIDVKFLWKGHPFKETGMNAILMYIGHTVTHKMLPWHWRVGSMNTHFVLLLETIWNTMIWIFIALYFYKKRFFYTI